METTEITVQSKVEEVVTKSGVSFELDLTEVSQLGDKAKAITSVDDENFPVVKKEMQQTRKYVTEYFKDARDEFNKMSKGIIEVQNMVLDEFVGEENRLKEMEKAEKERLVREAREAALPARKERLAAINDLETFDVPDGFEGSYDEFLMSLEDADFEIYVVQRQSDKNEADRIALEEEKARVAAEAKAAQDALAAEKAKQDAIEQARKEEREAAEERNRLEKERLEREASEAEERRLEAIRKEEADKARIAAEEKAKVEAEAKAKEEAEAARVAAAAAKAADEKYQAWKSGLGEGEFKFITLENGNVEAYKLVSTYAKN